MKKALTMALTAAMVLVMGVTAFALPDAVEPDNVGILDTIINFVTGIFRVVGEFIGIIFK